MHDITKDSGDASWSSIFNVQYIKSRWKFDKERPSHLSLDGVLEFLEFEKFSEKGDRKFMQSPDKKFVYYGSPKGLYWPILADGGVNNESLMTDLDILAESRESRRFNIGKNIFTNAHYWFIPAATGGGAIAFSPEGGAILGILAAIVEGRLFYSYRKEINKSPKAMLENICAHYQLSRMSAQSEEYAIGADALTSLTRLAESKIMKSLTAEYDPQQFTEITDIATASEGNYVKVTATDITYRRFSPHIAVEPSNSLDLSVDSIPIRRVQPYSWQDLQERYKFNELPPEEQQGIKFNFGLEPVQGAFFEREQHDAPVVFYGVARGMDNLNPFVELLGFVYNGNNYPLAGDIAKIVGHMKEGINALQYSKASPPTPSLPPP